MAKKIPKRMCISCREMLEKRELKRIVRTPEEEVLFDPGGKKSGKGAYLCSKSECYSRARKNRLLEKHLKCRISADIYNQLEEILQNES